MKRKANKAERVTGLKIVHFANYQTLEDLQDGLKVFGHLPNTRKFLHKLFEYMKYDVRKDAAPRVEPMSGNAFRKLLRRELHVKNDRRRKAHKAPVAGMLWALEGEDL